MAFYRIGALTFNVSKQVFNGPIFVLPSSVNLPKRYAARKGYRDKAKKQKQLEKLNATVTRGEQKLLKKFTKIVRTIDQKKPEPPNDDVIVLDHFNYKKYSLPEIIKFHREYHHPTVFNNPGAKVSLKIEVHMVGKKETQFLKPFSGLAPIPHPFTLSTRREVLVFCKPDDVESALQNGATIAGGVDLVKKVKEGAVQPVLYDYILADSSFVSELTPIRKILKLQFPKAKQGTLTNDLKFAIQRFLHGIQYSCVKVGGSQDFGIIDLDIGTLDMEINQLEENFRAVLKDIEQFRPKREGKFISWIWCLSRPSTEEFSVDLSQYIESEKILEDSVKSDEVGKGKGKRAKAAAVDEDDEDDDDDVVDEEQRLYTNQ